MSSPWWLELILFILRLISPAAYQPMPELPLEYVGRYQPEPAVTIPTPAPTVQATAPVVQAGDDYVVDDYLDYMHQMEDAYGLPRGIIAAMSIWESSGGLHRCGYNLTGYASCSVTFSSFEEGIEVTARTLSGYPQADIMGKLCTWQNGGGTNPCPYGERVIATMSKFQ